ncbi:MAG: hypothetical protein Q4G40_09810 [Brachybacterium sp.]|nr:hypothetical protein [Brachybacterium sp.]
MPTRAELRDAAGAPTLDSRSTASSDRRTLVRTLVRLRWVLWRRSFRKNVGKTIGTVIAVLYGAGMMAALLSMVFTMAALGGGWGEEVFPQVVRGLGAVAVLAWLLIPIFAFGIDDTLDPRRLALLPRRPSELQPGMFAASFVSLPALFTVLGVLAVSAAQVLWLLTSGVPSAVLAILAVAAMVPANLAGVALCLLLPRAVLAHAATRSSSRSSRELTGVLVLVGAIAVAYGGSVLIQRIPDLMSYDMLTRVLGGAVEVLAWTPFGALFAVPMDLAEGHLLTALARALIGAATLVLVWRWWGRSLRIALTDALVGDASSGAVGTTRLVPRGMPANAFGASVGRSLRYWRRDSRYLAAALILPVMMLFFLAMGMVSGGQSVMSLGAVVFIAGFASISLMNDFGYDGPAGWTLITSGVSPRTNIAGRIAAMAVIAVPFVVLSAIAVPLVLGRGDLAPLLLALSLGSMLSGWGVCALISVLMPYASAAPGTNPMRDKSASSANAMLAMGVGSIGLWIPQIPALVLAIWGLVTGSAALQISGAIVSLVTGAVVCILGVLFAARILRARYPEIFQKVKAFI